MKKITIIGLGYVGLPLAIEFGTPTYARDLAEVTLKILDSNNRIDLKGKIYNYSNLGETNWFSFAKEIVKLSNVSCKIKPVSSIEFQSKVRRPKYSVMCKNKIIKDFDIKINHWRDSLKFYINFDLK